MLEWKRLAQLAQAASPQTEWDAVIVGAGAAGLRAAYELRKQNILILESDAQPGGRVRTRAQKDIAYDMGAVFGFDARALPFALNDAESIVETVRPGIARANTIHFGADVFDCLRALDFSSDEWSALARFGADAQIKAEQLPPRAYAALNAFFQVIHPGDLRAYALPRQRDALTTFATTHYVKGNQVLVDALIARGELQSRLRTRARVTAIVDQGARVRVEYQHNETAQSIFARAVIVTVPPPIARALVTPLAPQAARYLAALQYAPGVVVAFGVRGALPEFSYIVTPDAPTGTILQQHTKQQDTRVLLVYYAGDKAAQALSLQDDALLAQTRAALQTLRLDGEIIFSDIQRWQYAGPVITPQACAAWSPECVQLTPRVILGGEAASFDPHQPMPYGVSAALSAGRAASEICRARIAASNASPHTPRPMLVDATVYRLTDTRPIFIERAREGNVAYYGLILQATRDHALKQYLLDCARDGLWEYQLGFGVTAEDSALVLEGLLACDVERALLEKSLQELVTKFYDAEQGAFHTVRGGRAAYWRGPSIDATAQSGYLMQCIAPEAYAALVRACAAFVAREQLPHGLWQGRWFPSQMVTTFYALRLLHEINVPDYETVGAHAITAIQKAQLQNGSWRDSVIETAAAMLALRLIAPKQNALARARVWLETQRVGNAWRGEPMLYYWFEEAGEKFFYHCADRGEISGAWAMLALA